MFKITKLKMYSLNGDEYSYSFQSGVNYFKGVNNSGKTEFYNFIDYMFGSSENLTKKPWYANTFDRATMIFEFNQIKYCITRTRDPQINYFIYDTEDDSNRNDHIDLTEYKEKLNTIFSKGEYKNLKNIKDFTNENLTYRTFTMFNFLGEKRQGLTYNFLDKCSDIKYYSKLMPLLNYIFNNNLEQIYELQKELTELQKQIKKLEAAAAKYEFIYDQVNANLRKLESSKLYNGKNDVEILHFIKQYKNLEAIDKVKKSKNIIELEVMYNSLDEQIKIYENRITDTKQIQKENENRKILLEKLDSLIKTNEDFIYLVAPLKKLISELDTSISFSKYLINDNTIQELKTKRDLLKNEIKDNQNRFKIFTVEEKTKSIALIEEYLSTNVESVDEELLNKQKRAKEIKVELKVLHNSDDLKKLKGLTNHITYLYTSAVEISDVVEEDTKQKGFKIQYYKKGNILQPVRKEYNDEMEETVVNYYVGSMARHTLIQLCGYLAFIEMMLLEDKYPLIPLLVIDHISKPFDTDNSKAIGKIISAAYESIGKENLQLFIFDDKQYIDLGLEVSHFENLVTDTKTGFIPFYKPDRT
ncbi:AAA family ATPase [Metabacillus fastidiosus]|uniref:AAA family ATPase n=1 Tax=Metabacillus fastidiosus TaxID=1458 RepID=UPI003D29C856